MLGFSRTWGLVAVAFMVLSLAGCPGTMGGGDGSAVDVPTTDAGGRDTPGTDMDGSAPRDTGRDDVGGGDASSSDTNGTDSNGAVTCGSTTCPVGEVCCNESCGICTPPGGSCIELACVDAGMTDGGGARSCGGFVGDAFCTDTEYCDHETLDCGSIGLCTARPTMCTRELAPVCGCDGMTYSNACIANAAGTDIASTGACGSTSDCDPQDARGAGACGLFLGYRWDGSACVGVSGCSCVGADCGALEPDLDVCIAAHRGCAVAVGFDCGPDLTCRTGSEYCEQFSGGPMGAIRYSCNPLPDRCASDPSCASCFPSPGPGGGTCREAGRGEIYFSIFAP